MNLPSFYWDEVTYLQYIQILKSMADEDYAKFHSKIVPDSGCEIFGVRVPKLRECAKEICKSDFAGFLDYVDSITGKRQLSYEEITVYGLVVGMAKRDFEDQTEDIRIFSKLVNNWASCDIAVSSFKEIKNHMEEYKTEIKYFLSCENKWQQRVGIVILLDFYLNNEQNARYALESVNKVRSGEYYVQMAEAWLIATAFAKYRDLTKKYLESDFDLGRDVLKMTVRKIRDSYRVSPEDKAWAKELQKNALK